MHHDVNSVELTKEGKLQMEKAAKIFVDKLSQLLLKAKGKVVTNKKIIN